MPPSTTVERAGSTAKRLEEILGKDAGLLTHQCRTVARDALHLPGPDFVDRVFAATDRSPRVLGALQLLFNTGRLGGTAGVRGAGPVGARPRPGRPARPTNPAARRT